MVGRKSGRRRAVLHPRKDRRERPSKSNHLTVYSAAATYTAGDGVVIPNELFEAYMDIELECSPNIYYILTVT